MRRLLFAAAAVLSTAVHAEEISWNGWFAGLSAGYADTAQINGGLNYNAYGPYAEASVGRWWSVDPVMLGFDLGLGIGGPRASLSGSAGAGTSWSYEPQDHARVSLRFLAGMPLKDSLLYIAAGPHQIWTIERSNWTDGPLSHDTITWTQKSGTSVALGLEQALSKTLSLKAELAHNTFYVDPTRTATGWSAKAGFNYHF